MDRREYEELLAEQPDVSIESSDLGEFTEFTVSCHYPKDSGHCYKKESLPIHIYVSVLVNPDTLKREIVLRVLPQTYRRNNLSGFNGIFNFLGLVMRVNSSVHHRHKSPDVRPILRKVLFGLRIYKAYQEPEQTERPSLGNSRICDFGDMYDKSADTISLHADYIISEISKILEFNEGRQQ
ncbi:MAG: hypothetical protein HY617_01325 [Candidatus Sungbacteria bacterium]|nr:hypothetical protein [Candidatus Sungbacteria bacterium]